MNLTIFETKKLEFLHTEIQTLCGMIRECDKHLEFIDSMYDFFFIHCRDLEESDRESINQEKKSTESLKKDYESRLKYLRDSCAEMGEKSRRIYNQYSRVHRFAKD